MGVFGCVSSSPGALGVLALALTLGRAFYSPCMRRLVRNAALPGIPDPVAPLYAPCSDADLIQAVSLVVTVKDTCGQAEELLTHLAGIFPKDMAVFYAYPSIRGCRHVPAGELGRRLFANFTEVTVGISDAPIAGFLKVQPLLKTKYAVLMHNDAYPMERDFACEMFRALEAHPEYPIAAPQIYEAASDKVIVPHGHHQNLHLRPTATGDSLKIDYDLSMHLMTQRKPSDFQEGPQVDFLEDHAFFARSDKYHELLDPSGSFTMEYIDMILNMRARNTSAWYVPTARCIFDVDTGKITWEDLPYLVYKRSEQIGHTVRRYLSNKWGVQFPNTGIWNYVRYVNLAEIVLEKEGLPEDWKDQAAVFYSWFENAGLNRYGGRYLPEFIEDPSDAPVNVSRTLKQTLSVEVLPHRVPPKTASQILHQQSRKTMGIPEITFESSNLPIALRTRSCDASDPLTYETCGLAIQDGSSCTCWNYVVPFNLKTTLYLDKLMAWLKLPARAFMYAQMKYWTVPVDPNSVDLYCALDQEDCGLQVHFSRNARVLQWSMFGKQTKAPFTPEGVAIAVLLLLMVAVPLLLSTHQAKQWMGLKKQQLRSLYALNRAMCAHAVRS